jgi:hypothetical protein
MTIKSSKSTKSARVQTPSFNGNEISKLEIPDWVPPTVTQWAMKISRVIKPPKIEVLRRLLTDPRMEAVWRELFKRKRGNGPYRRFFHPAIHVPYRTEEERISDLLWASFLRRKGGKENLLEAQQIEIDARIAGAFAVDAKRRDSVLRRPNASLQDIDQEIVAKGVFRFAYEFAINPTPVVTAKVANEAANEFLGYAKTLKEIMRKLRRVGFPIDRDDLRAVLRIAADVTAHVTKVS